MFKKLVDTKALMVIMLIGFLVRCYNLNEPFIGIHDWGSTDLSRAASSLFRYDYFELKGAPVFDIGPVTDGNFSYYLNWPLLFYYLIAASFAIFGEHEWAARIIPAIFGTVSIYVVYLISEKMYCRKSAYLASILFALMPLNVYFNRIVQFETVSVFFILLCLYIYILWCDSKYSNNRTFFWLLISFILGTQVHWQNYIVAGILFGHWLVTGFLNKNYHGRRQIMLLPISAVILFITHMSYMVWVKGGSAISEMLNQAKHRLNVSGENREVLFTFGEFISVQLSRFYHFFTAVVCVLVLLWGLFTLLDLLLLKENGKKRLMEFVVIALGLSWIVIFLNHSYIHEFSLLTMAAATCILAASGFNSIITFFSNRLLRRRSTRYINNFAVVSMSLVVLLFLPQAYTEAKGLHSWHGDLEKWYKLGKAIGDYTDENAIIIAEFEHPGPPTIEYYANRKIVYNVKDPKEIQNSLSNDSIQGFYLISTLDKALLNYKDYDMVPVSNQHVLISLDGKSIVKNANVKELNEIVLDGSLEWEAFGEQPDFKIVRVRIGVKEQPYLIEKNGTFLSDQDADAFNRADLSDIYPKNKYLYMTVSNLESGWPTSFNNKHVKEYFNKHSYKLYIFDQSAYTEYE